MRTEIIVVDNFYADPLAVRTYALQQDYYFPYECRDDVIAGHAQCTWMASRFKEWIGARSSLRADSSNGFPASRAKPSTALLESELPNPRGR